MVQLRCNRTGFAIGAWQKHTLLQLRIFKPLKTWQLHLIRSKVCSLFCAFSHGKVLQTLRKGCVDELANFLGLFYAKRPYADHCGLQSKEASTGCLHCPILLAIDFLCCLGFLTMMDFSYDGKDTLFGV